MGEPTLVPPDYGGACVTEVVPALLRRHSGAAPGWLPGPLVGAEQVVLLVLDGLGWEQLQARPDVAPTITSMAGGPITTVAPSTTATALTSLTTGSPPAHHGIVGYRMRVGEVAVLNVLRWTTPEGDARRDVVPEAIQRLEPFAGTKPPVVTRQEFAESGFSRAHLAGSQMFGWRYSSSLVTHVGRLVAEGHELIYAYYPGVDTVAHEYGFGDFYDAELAAADRLVDDLLATLPAGVAVAVVADHGQVHVGERLVPVTGEVAECTALLSGEGRFRWLHAVRGGEERLAAAAREQYGHQAWVRTRDEVVAAGWLGGEPPPDVAARLGDVALVARDPVAFLDPADTGSYELQCRHGSLTAAEMLVPCVAARA